MSDPFLGEIQIFGFNFSPRGWAFCDGQLLPIAQYTALFSLLGTYYGGDGRTTFALPDLRGRVPLNDGSGPGLSPKRIGEVGGRETNTLDINHMASHSHAFSSPSNSGAGNTDSATGSFPAQTAEDNYNSAANSAMGGGMTASTGASAAINNMQPYLTTNFCIALEGLYPSRS